MIPYIEIINKNSLKIFALVEPKECWFELAYCDIGEFEIYCLASTANMANLQKGNYVKIPNKPYVWVITSLNYTYVEGVPMISAKGFEAKWLLNKRIIQAPIELPNKVAQAVENLVYTNCSTGAADAARIMGGFTVAISGITTTLTDTQAPRANLLEFVNSLLQTYNLGFITTYNNGVIVFKVIQGQDLSQTVRFSQSLDNLIQTNYLTDDSKLANKALVVSNVNDNEYMGTYNTGGSGVDLAEILVSSNLSTEYTPVGASDPVKLDLTNPADRSLYISWLVQEGKTQLANYMQNNEFNSILDLENSIYEFDNDYTIGDLVGVIDEYFNINTTARIIKITFKQDSGGYGEEATYE